ncbi:MAG: GNAT family N-acetyltransferase [Vicinamibacterales bacterium]
MKVFSDHALAKRLELTEGRGNAAFVEVQARQDPTAGATWRDIGGTLAMFSGVGSPLTQTFGLGVGASFTESDLDAIEAFFTTRGSSVFHEVSPLAGVEVFATLAGRGYRPVELSSVMFRVLDSKRDSEAVNPRIRVREVTRDEAGLYASVSARGWSETAEVQAFIDGFARVSVEYATCTVAELDGTAIAAAALYLSEGVGLLAGASTVPEGRRQGAQAALLDWRLKRLAAEGCDLAMICAAPGSASQRNAERNGFRIAYTRTKWQR